MKSFISASDFKKGTKGAVSKVATIAAPEATVSPRTLKFTISTGEPDRDADVINQTGINLTNYMRNPVVLGFHDSDTFPVGKCTSMAIENGNLTATVEFIDQGIPIAGPIAECMYQLCSTGFLNATSIGFLPIDWEWSADRPGGVDFASVELLEFSIVPIPCNPDALIIDEPKAAKLSDDNKSLNKSDAHAAMRRKRLLTYLA